MKITDVQPVIAEFFERLDAKRSWRTEGTTVAAGTYADPSHLARELETLFAGPQAVALTPDLPEPGSHLALDTLPIPVVLTRTTDGDARAFANVCAHRGSQVVEPGRGCTRRLTCPYHAWSYDLEGTLVSVPDAGSFPDVEVGGTGLRPLPCVEANGVIWVTPDPAGPAPEPDLGFIADDLDHYDVAGHHHWRSHRFELELNWKLVIDTFLEGYHFASLHRDTVGPLFLSNLCHAATHGPHLREILPRRSIEQLRDRPPETWDVVPHSAIVYVLFPTTVFVMQLDHIETWRVSPHPTDPARSVTDLDFYIPELPHTDSALTHWEKNWRLTIDTVIQEDFKAMAGVQRGMASGVLEHTTIGANEPALARFHDALARALT